MPPSVSLELNLRLSSCGPLGCQVHNQIGNDNHPSWLFSLLAWFQFLHLQPLHSPIIIRSADLLKCSPVSSCALLGSTKGITAQNPLGTLSLSRIVLLTLLLQISGFPVFVPLFVSFVSISLAKEGDLSSERH